MNKKLKIRLKGILKSSSNCNKNKDLVLENKEKRNIKGRIRKDFLDPVLNLIDNEGLDDYGNCLLTVDGLCILKEVLENLIDSKSNLNINDILNSFLEESEVIESVEEYEEEDEEYEEEDDEEDDDEDDECDEYDIDELNELDDYVVDLDGDFYDN